MKDLSSKWWGAGRGGGKKQLCPARGTAAGRKAMGQGCGGAVLGSGPCCVSQDQLLGGEAILRFQLMQLKYLE